MDKMGPIRTPRIPVVKITCTLRIPACQSWRWTRWQGTWEHPRLGTTGALTLQLPKTFGVVAKLWSLWPSGLPSSFRLQAPSNCLSSNLASKGERMEGDFNMKKDVNPYAVDILMKIYTLFWLLNIYSYMRYDLCAMFVVTGSMWCIKIASLCIPSLGQGVGSKQSTNFEGMSGMRGMRVKYHQMILAIMRVHTKKFPFPLCVSCLPPLIRIFGYIVSSCIILGTVNTSSVARASWALLWPSSGAAICV